MASRPALNLQRLLFLDTNAMHYARLYLEFAQERGIAPLGDGAAKPDEEIKRTYTGRTCESYMNGCRLVDYLRSQCLSDACARVEYSPVTQLELVCGLLRGQAIVNAAQEGIPHRMWSRIDEGEILHRLKPSTYRDVERRIGAIDDLFVKADVTISETRPESMRDAWLLARRLLSLVYMDLGDLIVYASALLAEADEFITYDAYLKKVANKLQKPDGIDDPVDKECFRGARNTIVGFMAQRIGIEESQISLPAAIKV